MTLGVPKMGGPYKPTKIELNAAMNALRELRQRCDGARARDGQGFGKFDAARGRHLTELGPQFWTEGDFKFARHCAAKYWRQISECWLEDLRISVWR